MAQGVDISRRQRLDQIGFFFCRLHKTRTLLRRTLAPIAMMAGTTVAGPALAVTCVDYKDFIDALDKKTITRITDESFCPAVPPPNGPDSGLRRAIGSAISSAKMDGCGWEPRGDGSGMGFVPVPGHYLRFRNYDGSVWFHVSPWDQKESTEAIVEQQRKALDKLSKILSDRLMRCMNPAGKYGDMRIFPTTVAPDDPPLPFGYGDGQQPEGGPGKIARYTPADIAALAESLGTLVDEAKQRDLSEFKAPEPEEGEDSKSVEGEASEVGEGEASEVGEGEDAEGENSGEDSTGTGTSSSSSGLIPGGAAWLGDLMRMVLAYFGLDQYAQFGLMALAMLAPELLEQIGELAEAVTAGLKSDSLDEFMSKAREIFMLAMAVNATMDSIDEQFGGIDNFKDALASTSKVLQDMPPELRKELEKTMGVEGKIDELAQKATGLSELPISFDFTDPNMAAELGKLVGEVAKKKAREEVQKFLVKELDLDGLGIPVESFMQAASGVFEGDDRAAENVGRLVLQGIGSKAGLSPQDIDDLTTGGVGTVMKRRGKAIARKEIRDLAEKNGLNVDLVAIWEGGEPVEEAGRVLTEAVIERLPPEYRVHARGLANAVIEGDVSVQREAARKAAKGIAVLELARHMDPARAQDLTGIAEAILTDEDPVAVSESIMIAELARNLKNPDALDGVTNFQGLLEKASDEPGILAAAVIGKEPELVTLAVQFAAGDPNAAEALRKQGMRRAFDMVEELGADLEEKAVEALRAELRRHPDLLRHSGTVRCLAGAKEAPADCVQNIGEREKKALYDELASLDPSVAALTDALVSGDTDAAAAIIRKRAVDEAGALRRSLEGDAFGEIREALADLPSDIRDTTLVRKMAEARSLTEMIRIFGDNAAIAALRADIAAVDPVLAEVFDALEEGDIRQVKALLEARGRRELQSLRRDAEARALAALREALEDAPPLVQSIAADLRTAATLDEAMAVLSSVSPDGAARKWLASKDPLLAQAFDAASAGDGEALQELAVASGRNALNREALRILRRPLNRLPETSLTIQLREAETFDMVRAVIDEAGQDALDQAIAEIVKEDRSLANAVREVFAAVRAKDDQRLAAAFDVIMQRSARIVQSRAQDVLLSKIKALATDEAILVDAGLADAETLEEAIAIVRRTLTCDGMLSLSDHTGIGPEAVAVMRAACEGTDIDLRYVSEVAIREGRIALETEAKTRALDALHNAARDAGLGPDHAVIQARTLETALAALQEAIKTVDQQIIERIRRENPDLAVLLTDFTAAGADPAEVTRNFVLDQAKEADAKLAKRLAANLRRLASDIRPPDLRDLVLAQLENIENLADLETALQHIRKDAPAALSALHPDLVDAFDEGGKLDTNRMRAVVEAVALRAAARAERRLQGAVMERVREAIKQLDPIARHPSLERLAHFDDLRKAAAYVRRLDRATWAAIAARAGRASPDLQTVLVALAEGSLDRVADVAATLAQQAVDDAVTRIEARTLEGIQRWLLARSWLEKKQIQRLAAARTLDDLKDFGREERVRLCADLTDHVTIVFCELINDAGRVDVDDVQRVFSTLPERPRTALAGVGRLIAEKGLKDAVQNGFSSAGVVPDAAAFATALIAGEKVDIEAQLMAQLLHSDAVAALDPTMRAAFIAMLKGQNLVDAAIGVLFGDTDLPDEIRKVLREGDVQVVLRDFAGEIARDTVAGAMVHVAKTVAEAEINSEKMLATVSSLLEEEAALRTIGPRTRRLLATWMTGGDVQTMLQEVVFEALNLDAAESEALLAGNLGPALAGHIDISAPPSFVALLIQLHAERLTSAQQRILRDPKSEGREALREALTKILRHAAKIDEEIDNFLRAPEQTAARLLADKVCGDDRNACSPQRQAITQELAFEKEAQFLPGGARAVRRLLAGDPSTIAARLTEQLTAEIAGQVRENCAKKAAGAAKQPRQSPSGIIDDCTDFATALAKATTGKLVERRAYLSEELEAKGRHLVTVSSMEAVGERRARIHFYARYARYREACVAMDGRYKNASDAEDTTAVACAPCDALFKGAEPPADPGKALETHAIFPSKMIRWSNVSKNFDRLSPHDVDRYIAGVRTDVRAGGRVAMSAAASRRRAMRGRVFRRVHQNEMPGSD